MKKLLVSTITLILTVTFLYYLLTQTTFLPYDKFGNHDWINILTLLVLAVTAISTALFSTIYTILWIIDKEEKRLRKGLISLKYSTIITIGLTLVFVLNFFHILDILWGLAILIVVLIATFII